MPTLRKPRVESQAETREHLLDAAGQLFETRGFHRTSVAQIAASAGYTTGAIYSNFPRKEDLALAVVNRGTDAQWERLESELTESTDLGDRLAAVVTWRKRLLITDASVDVLRLELCVYALKNERLRSALASAQRQQQARVARILLRVATDAGAALTVDPDVLAGALLGAADGTAIAGNLDPASKQAEAFALALVTLVVTSMKPRPVPEESWAEFVERALAGAVHG